MQNARRNFGTVVAFTISYLTVALIGVEWLDYGVSGIYLGGNTQNDQSQRKQTVSASPSSQYPTTPETPLSGSKFSQTTTDTSTPESSILKEKKPIFSPQERSRGPGLPLHLEKRNPHHQPTNQRRLPNSITCYVNPSSLTALMGRQKRRQNNPA